VSRFLEGENLPVYNDSMILAWLINPQESHALDNLSQKYLSHTMLSYKETVKKGRLLPR
jgi:DNA polymerase I - 3''-5'' exonuclease and polymerase domains